MRGGIAVLSYFSMKEGVFMKKLITGITALPLIAMSLVPLTSSSLYIPAGSFEVIRKQLDGYTYITDFAVSEKDPNYPSDYSLYIQLPEETETFSAEKSYGVKLLMKENYDTLDITVPGGNGRKVLSAAMQDIGIDGKVFTDDDIKCECRIYNNVSKDDIKLLYSKLNGSELITEFIYSTELYSVREGVTNNEHLGEFSFCSYDYDTGKWTSPEEQLTKYNSLVELAETLLPGSSIELDSFDDKELGFTAYSASVIPSGNISIEERIDFALKVKKEIGVFGGFAICESPAPILKAACIDFVDAIEGDANCDGSVNIADAVYVMQVTTNPDIYAQDKSDLSISAQGEFNADVDGIAGLTNEDALFIQKYKLGLISNSPVEQI